MGLIDVNKTTPLEHPYEEGVVVNVRSLRGTEMDEAELVKTKDSVVAWGSTLEAIQGLSKAREQQPEKDTLAIRVAKYDATTLLGYAIVSWSYKETVTPDDIKNLDGVTRQWLVEEVVSRNTRPLPPSSNGDSSLSPESARTN
jgi:hypothetical protein